MQLHPGQTGRKDFQSSDDGRLALGVDEFAKSIGVGRTIVFAEIKSGRLKARKLGKQTLIYDQDGRAWFESLPVIAREVAEPP